MPTLRMIKRGLRLNVLLLINVMGTINVNDDPTGGDAAFAGTIAQQIRPLMLSFIG